MRVIDILHSPWAIVPNRYIEICEIYGRHLRGEKISRETIALIEASIGKPLKNEPKGYDVVNGVAVVPLDGVLSKRMNLFSQISGGTSTELFVRDFNAALADPAVKAIILNIDSPGGTVDGTQEAANAVYAAKDKKPVATFSNGMMASAAYWIGSAAQSGVYLSGDTVDMGSIGVVTSHTDYSRAYEQAGIKVTELTAGKYKRIASEYGPLTESGRAYMQDQLDHIYGVFLSDVGRNRGGLAPDQVHEQMADGRIFIGKKAIGAGLADGVSSLDELISKMASGEMSNGQKMPVKKKDMPMKPGMAIAVPEKIGEQTAAGDAAAESETEEAIMDVKELQEKHPDVYKSVFDTGKAAGAEEGKAAIETARKEGAAAESARIKGVFDLGKKKPGHAALAEQAMFDGAGTKESLAVAIVEAESAKLEKKADDIKKDGEDLKVPSADASGQGANMIKRSQFEAMNPKQRAEFVKAGGKVTD